MGVLAGAKSPLLLRSLRVVQAILAIIVLGLAAYGKNLILKCILFFAYIHSQW